MPVMFQTGKYSNIDDNLWDSIVFIEQVILSLSKNINMQ